VSCFGYKACYNADIGRIVGGCNGTKACYYAGYDGSLGEITSSCYGYHACAGAAYSYGIIRKISSSCHGNSTCSYITAYGGKIETISNSCQGKEACAFTASCYYLICGSNITEISSNQFGGSCEGERACYGAAYEEGGIGRIESSCRGNHTCFYAAASGSIAVRENVSFTTLNT